MYLPWTCGLRYADSTFYVYSKNIDSIGSLDVIYQVIMYKDKIGIKKEGNYGVVFFLGVYEISFC
ncbi:hypothetical protein D3C75_1271700 [compost metagenome]